MRAAIPLLIVGAIATVAWRPAQAARLTRADAAADRYAQCLSLVKSNARAAEATANAWHDEGGGAPSLHCGALALVAQHDYAGAAVKLDQAALLESAGHDLRSALFDQAGNAWLLAGEPQKAEASFTSALALSHGDEDLLFDRARARAARKDWPGADSDLTALLKIDGNRADALVLRAGARHALGKNVEANADIAGAFDVYPDYPDALVERGEFEYEAGDVQGARADWQMAARDQPDGDAGRAAREHLAATNTTGPAPAK